MVVVSVAVSARAGCATSECDRCHASLFFASSTMPHVEGVGGTSGADIGGTCGIFLALLRVGRFFLSPLCFRTYGGRRDNCSTEAKNGMDLLRQSAMAV